MAVVALLLHPATSCNEVRSIAVQAMRTGSSSIRFNYSLKTDLGRTRIPERVMQSRRDELWRHTCFEAFVSPVHSTQYFEFNFSPSTEWAAYGFDNYRDGMCAASVTSPIVDVTRSVDTLVLNAEVDLAPLGMTAAEGKLEIGLSAIIENIEGQISYWAIKHALPKPDFHHRDGFALLLA